jgi:hypothetical protein
VNALTVYDQWLIVGGSFPRLSNQDFNGIARWNK